MDNYTGHIVASWSGGIDSTAVIAQLLSRGYAVHAVTFGIYNTKAPLLAQREREARAYFDQVFADSLGGKLTCVEEEADWMWRFSADGLKIPRRNRHIIDRLLAGYCGGVRRPELALGQYVGADTWTVRDRIGAADADARALTAYVYHEHDLTVRLWTLADFGECRYNHERLSLLWEVLEEEGHEEAVLSMTTSCTCDTVQHCGQCHKCIERAAAFYVLNLKDETQYVVSPRDSKAFTAYLDQMQGDDVCLQEYEL